MDKNYKILAIPQDKWTLEMEKYKENLKNKVEYKYIEEPNLEDESGVLNDIFSSQKIEVK